MTFPNPHRVAGGPGPDYYFRIGQHKDMKGKSKVLDASFAYNKTLKGGDTANVTIKAVSKSGIDLDMDTHLMMRSSNYNPFAEVWVVGDISVITTIDLLVRAPLAAPEAVIVIRRVPLPSSALRIQSPFASCRWACTRKAVDRFLSVEKLSFALTLFASRPCSPVMASKSVSNRPSRAPSSSSLTPRWNSPTNARSLRQVRGGMRQEAGRQRLLVGTTIGLHIFNEDACAG